jgi:L-aspartate oxidase
MGGVRTDLDGRTSVRRLFAAGEVACTGVHGANRLASNSLLEGVVFGARAGIAMREWSSTPMLRSPLPSPEFPDISEADLRRLAWETCGITRSGEGLQIAIDRLAAVRWTPCPEPNRLLFEVRGMCEVVSLIARCALARKESRGGHYRIDYPEKSPEFQKHSLITKSRNEVVYY